MQSTTMKVTLVVVCVLIFHPSNLINATPVGPPKLINAASGACPCIVPGEGMCQELDQNGMYWCLVAYNNVGNCCDGGIYPPGNIAMTNCKNYSNCRLSVNINGEGAANLDD